MMSYEHPIPSPCDAQDGFPAWLAKNTVPDGRGCFTLMRRIGHLEPGFVLGRPTLWHVYRNVLVAEHAKSQAGGRKVAAGPTGAEKREETS